MTNHTRCCFKNSLHPLGTSLLSAGLERQLWGAPAVAGTSIVTQSSSRRQLCSWKCLSTPLQQLSSQHALHAHVIVRWAFRYRRNWDARHRDFNLDEVYSVSLLQPCPATHLFSPLLGNIMTTRDILIWSQTKGLSVSLKKRLLHNRNPWHQALNHTVKQYRKQSGH